MTFDKNAVTVDGEKLSVYISVYYQKLAKYAIETKIAEMIRDAVVKEIENSPELQAKLRDLVVQKLIGLLEQGGQKK